MASYTLHLGFHCGSPVIGSVFGDQGPTKYRTLQYALADSSGNPAWFRFAPRDTIAVVVWNLTQSSSVAATIQSVGMSFLVLEGATEGAMSPDTFVSCENGFGTTANYKGVDTKPYLEVALPTAGASVHCPWGPFGTGYTVGGAMRLKAPSTLATSFKWSFCVRATPGSDAQQTFLSDPEVIVGSQGEVPTKPAV